MARVTYVAKAQASKRARTCITCGTTINKGEPYKHASIRAGNFGSGRLLVWCNKHNPKPSQMTTSDKKATIYAAIEDAEENIANWDGQSVDDLRGYLEAAAESIREAAEMYRESASNIEEGFGHSTSTSDELNERADEVESAANELEIDFEEFEEDDARGDAEGELGTLEEWIEGEGLADDGVTVDAEATKEAYEAAINELVEGKRSEWADAQRELATDALSSVEV